MDSRMVVRLEEDLAKSACHEQTGGVLNGGMAVRVRAKCAGAWLCGGRGGSKGWEGMVREATVTSLEKASNSAFSLISGPRRSKTGRRTRSRNFARAAPDLLPTCPATAGRSCLEEGAHVEPALSLARSGAGAASIRANWQLRQTVRHHCRPIAPRQASLQAWPTAGMNYRQGNY